MITPKSYLSLVERLASALPPFVVWLLISIPSTLALVFITPPFQVPDEPQHFLRAYQLSELELFGSVRDGVNGSTVPSSLSALIVRFMGTTELHTKRVKTNQPLRETWREMHRPLRASEREFANFSMVTYSPLGYVPQAAGVGIGRLLEAPPLALLYLGRAANALFAVSLIAWALYWLPMARPLALVVALLPMALFEYASVSADGPVIAGAFLFTAAALRAATKLDWTRLQLAVAILAASTFCSVKPTYAPLLLVPLLPAFNGGGQRPAYWLHCGVVISIPLVVSVLWLWSSSSTSVVVPGRDPSGQVRWLMEQPPRLVWVLVDTFATQYSKLTKQFVGVLGWLNVDLPSQVRFLATGAAILGLLAGSPDDSKLTRWQSVVSLLLVFGSVVLVAMALYVTWTPVGYPVVHGIQGRYFLPLAPLACAVAASLITPVRSQGVRRFAYFALVAICLWNTLEMLRALNYAYFVL
jgi:uncharacterized membrane protein